jgi:hypothetical protein
VKKRRGKNAFTVLFTERRLIDVDYDSI